MRWYDFVAWAAVGLVVSFTSAAAADVAGVDTRALTQEAPLATLVVKEIELTPRLQFISPGANEEWLENATATIQWLTVGPIKHVRLYYYGDRTKLGGGSRGSFSGLISDAIPNEGSYRWTVPWVDARSFMLRLAGYDEEGKLMAETERVVRFRPSEASGLNGTYIVVSKRRQRLWYYQNDHLRWISIVSTAAAPFSTPNMRPGSSGRRGAMGRIFYKTPNAFSRMYQVNMPWWMAITSSGSHGIHATSSGFYRYLGSPASHGCIRQHRQDAKRLYDMVSVGTRVYVF
ncbi:MAG: L,D-transpeptidase family protein [candidate division WS1 bacterium]|jgi:lipoprotein-anchoring transpeptidase ErfK/SrfK|nr:L,D-transpeptidase family protein [candidate division WS1 bacterium]